MTTDTPLIWIARHGTTTDSNKKIFRGNRDSMLDRQGFLDAHELKEFFSNKTWKHLVCSDMTRSIQTATIIGEPRDETPIVLKDLDPWHIGYLTGKDKKQFKPDMEVFIEHPNMRPQDGETRNEFFGRSRNGRRKVAGQAEEYKRTPCQIGSGYPDPIVDGVA